MKEGLAEAQKMAHIGNWDRNLVTDEIYWSDEMYRIFGLNPQEFDVTYNAFLNYVHPDDRDYVDNAIKKALNGKPFDIDYRIILADGEERIVHAQGEVIFDEKNIPVRMRGTVQDITERKKAEERTCDESERKATATCVSVLLNRWYSDHVLRYWTSITDANEKFLEMVGYTSRRRIGKLDMGLNGRRSIRND